MKCPVCENAMITLELCEVEIDYCTDCQGIWLDSGELEILLGDMGRGKSLLESFATVEKHSEVLKGCPICDKKMQKVSVGVGPLPVLIDKCKRGDGIWFDKHELLDILKSATLDKDNKILGLLSEMFGE